MARFSFSFLGQITRDEAGHIAFHTDFFKNRQQAIPAWRAAAWRQQFRLLFRAARLVVWWEHGGALRHCGITWAMFQEKTGRACAAFLGGIAHARQPSAAPLFRSLNPAGAPGEQAAG